VSLTEKYDRLAAGFTEREYADPAVYAERCAQVICACSPGLVRGSSVLDLACGDGLMAGPFARAGLHYTGVDASARMVDAARARFPQLEFSVGRIEAFAPAEPVETAICLRTFYQLHERASFFRHVASYTRGTFVFDFRRHEFPDHAAIVNDLLAAGFASVELRPFLLPQMRRIPAAARPPLYALERSGPAARLLTRRIGRFFCVASV
jgi:SAM-dependent methyltransferase